jgi:hypothetical protein
MVEVNGITAEEVEPFGLRKLWVGSSAIKE